MCVRVRRWCFGVVVVWIIGSAVSDCPLPQHPVHGRHQAQGGDCGGADRPRACDGTPGTLAPEEWLLSVRCDPGYQAPDPEIADVPSICTNGVWSIPNLPDCVLSSIPLNSREQCVLPEQPPHSEYHLLAQECGGENLSPGSAVANDCILFLNCAPGYRRRDGGGEFLTHCSNKTWNPRIPNDLCIRGGDTVTNPVVPIEEPAVVKNPVIMPGGCMLPNASPTRKFCSLAPGCEDCDIYNRQCFVPPGSRVDRVGVVCAPGYGTRSNNNVTISVCLSSGWRPPIPECLRLCSPLVSEQLLLRCRFGTDIVDCSSYALPGTTVSFECLGSFSEIPDLASQGKYRDIIACRPSGTWTDNLPSCTPVCGVSKEVTEFSPTISNGFTAHIGLFPWHAGLYYAEDRDGEIFWDQKCGGSLISNWVVLTAAHCVYNVKESDLRVALGKYYRSWDRYEPTEKKLSVTKISIPNHYVSATFTFDIALLLLSEKIKFGSYIMPVCHNLLEGTTVTPNTKLYVVGWGKTSVGGQSSETLLYNAVTAMPSQQCRTAMPSFYIPNEKFCGLKTNSESVTQKGDSGGGLTAVNKDGLHYIVGITSARFNNISLFTNIKWKTHLEWIRYEINQYKIMYST